jgi:hypothetical protein
VDLGKARKRPTRIPTFALRRNLCGHRFFKHGEVTYDDTSSLSIDGFGCDTAAFLFFMICFKFKLFFFVQRPGLNYAPITPNAKGIPLHASATAIAKSWKPSLALSL